jgi:hypothetical protein
MGIAGPLPGVFAPTECLVYEAPSCYAGVGHFKRSTAGEASSPRAKADALYVAIRFSTERDEVGLVYACRLKLRCDTANNIDGAARPIAGAAPRAPAMVPIGMRFGVRPAAYIQDTSARFCLPTRRLPRRRSLWPMPSRRRSQSVLPRGNPRPRLRQTRRAGLSLSRLHG